MVCEDVLRIKNLPPELSMSEKEEFLFHFGATQVKILTNPKQKTTAYAKFISKENAKAVMLRLHQVLILNCRLCVEFAKFDVTECQPKQLLVGNSEADNKKHFKNFIDKLNALNSFVSFSQPPPPHLKYSYPKPNRATINNIGHALASVPEFYTQVLHLMNRMNLPPPFSDVPDPPQMQVRVAPTPMVNQQTNIPQQEDSKSTVTTSESEIESDPENSSKTEIIPKRKVLSSKKTLKRPKFIKPNVVPTGTPAKTLENNEDVFEKVGVLIQKKIELKVCPDSLINIQQNRTDENVGTFGNTTVEMDVSPERVESSTVITENELNANRIASKDIGILPVFKNYHPGVPTSRLYIKNIAKIVELSDLEYIYKRYVENVEGRESVFDIKLMKEGKMKGQAFVTLNSVELAKKAVTETNGYILKDKPLVVVFAKSAVPKK